MTEERPGETDPIAEPDIEAILEENRTLRLWADHLEARLARTAEQMDTWRQRAEDRKTRIAEIEGQSTRRRRKRSRSRTQPAPAAPTPRKDSPPEQRESTAAIVHPSVRVGVVCTTDTPQPDLLKRLNTLTLSDEDSLDALNSVDGLVLVGPVGFELAMRWDQTRTWIDRGHPVVSVSTPPQPGLHSIEESELTFYDESDDLFNAVFPPSTPLQPTLERLTASESDWAARILGEFESNTPPEDQERRAVYRLRSLRSERSPHVIAEMLLSKAGIGVPEWRKEALAVLQSRRSDFVVDTAARLAAQTYRPLRVAVGLHGQASEAEPAIRSVLEPSGIPFSIARFDADRPQGSCLNDLVAMSPGDVVLKIDDDDLYSSVYIEDMLGALSYSGADIVGKAASFFRLRSGDHVLIAGRRSYQPVEHVVGPTITATRAVWEAVRFPARHQRVDSKFLQAARAIGLRVVSHHPWDFCVIRHDRGNTWSASDEYFAGTGMPVDLEWEQMRTEGGHPTDVR